MHGISWNMPNSLFYRDFHKGFIPPPSDKNFPAENQEYTSLQNFMRSYKMAIPSTPWVLPGMSLNYPEINTESFLTSLTSVLFSHLSHFSSSLLSFLLIVRSSLYSFPPGHELNRSRNEHRIISESACLRTVKKFSVFLSLVKVFFFFFWVLYFIFHCTLTFNCKLWYICMLSRIFT